MSSTANRITRKHYFLAYTAGAFVMFAIIIGIFASCSKSFITNGDGANQHYIGLMYYGSYLREILKNIFIYHRLEIPMWDMKIGYGMDVLTTLHYYTIGDPLNLLSALVPRQYTEYLYDFLILVRIYLAGITFSIYCFYHKNKPAAVWLGAMMYIFTHWTFVAGFAHPYFLNPCIYLPLMLVGVDMIFDGKNPLFYILSVVLAGVSNFYFFYMLGIFTVIYGIFRYFMKFGKRNLKRVWGWLGKFAVYSICGILLAAPILMPQIMALLSTGRLKNRYFVPVLYKMSHYLALPGTLIGRRYSRYTTMGVASAAILALIILFLQWKKYTGLKIGFLLLLAMLSIPFAGHVMNGFSYVSNRWSWAMVMLLSYVTVKMYPKFFKLSVWQRAAALVLTLGYGWFVLSHTGKGNGYTYTSVMVLLALAVVFTAGYSFLRKKPGIWAGVMAVSIFACGFSDGYFYFLPVEKGEGKISSFAGTGSVYGKTHDLTAEKVKALPGIEETRVEQNNSRILFNAAMLNDFYGGQFYFSVPPEAMGQFSQENYLNNSVEQLNTGLNNRSWLMKLFSMGYYVGRTGNVPYGYAPEVLVDEEWGYWIHRDDNPLPFAYTYDTRISPEEFEKLNPIQRQEAMMETVVLENSSLPEGAPSFTSREIPCQVVESDGLKMRKGKVYAKKANASFVVEFKGDENCETALAFEKLKYLGRAPLKCSAVEIRDRAENSVWVLAEGDSEVNKTELFLPSMKYNFHSSRENFVLNTGYHEKPVRRIRMTFEQKGYYDISGMKVYCQKTDTLNDWANRRKTEAPQDLEISGNHISCSVDFSKDRALVFSVPYSKGWSLFVDGEEAQVKKANHIFLAAELPAGKHEVMLSYETPYLWAGILVCGLGVWLLIEILEKFKNENNTMFLIFV